MNLSKFYIGNLFTHVYLCLALSILNNAHDS